MTLTLFSPLHVFLIAVVATAGILIGFVARRRPEHRAMILRAMGLLLALLELVWYVYLLRKPFPIWPGFLPLHLCDVVVWLTVLSSLFAIQRIREMAYYWGLSGTSLALLMPDVQGLSVSYPVIQFFVSHGLVVATLLVMTISHEFRPPKGSLLRAVIVLHVYAGFVGGFNALFGTNYMYMRNLPSGETVLDLMGPWPWYLAGADAIGVVLFCLLWLPFRNVAPEQSVTPSG